MIKSIISIARGVARSTQNYHYCTMASGQMEKFALPPKYDPKESVW